MTVLTRDLASALVEEQGLDVVIPDKYTSIAEYAFQRNQLTSVVLPKGITSIGAVAFSGNNLTSIVIPHGVKTIGQAAFSGNQLSTVEIPDSVITLGNSAFSGNNLTSLIFGENLTSIGYHSFSSNQLTHVDIPNGVTSIGFHAFRDNELATINLPDSITNIGGNAFSGNQLYFVRIPDNYIYIHNDAFAENPLERISIPLEDTIRLQGLPDVEIIRRSDNLPPTNIVISRTVFNEIVADASSIATLRSSDNINSVDTYTYSLISGVGDTDNSAFSIDGDQLLIVDSPNFETKSSYSIRLQTKDSGGLTFEKSFDLTVNEWVTEQLIATTPTNTFPKFENSHLLATSPGGSLSLDPRQDFSFADYTYITNEGYERNSNRVKGAFYVSENTALLQYKYPDDEEGVSNNGEIVYAIRNNAGIFQKSFTYEAPPEISGYDPRGLVAFSYDQNDNLYSIRHDTNYDASNANDWHIHRLLAHDSSGKLLWSERLNYGTDFDLEYDNNKGLLITRAIFNSDVYYDHYSSTTGLKNWTANPYEEFIFGGFGTSQRSIQILDDDTFLASSSGHLEIVGDYYAGSYLAKLSLQDGSLKSFLPVDSDSSYTAHELFEKSGRIYLRTAEGVHKVRVDADPLKQVYPGILPIPDPEVEDTFAEAETIFKPKKFKKKFADKITGFNPTNDTLEIDIDSFGLDSSATFAAGKRKREVKKLAKQDFDFLYDQKKGGLYFNENGSDKGFGEGGIIAILKGAPELTSENLDFV